MWALATEEYHFIKKKSLKFFMQQQSKPKAKSSDWSCCSQDELSNTGSQVNLRRTHIQWITGDACAYFLVLMTSHYLEKKEQCLTVAVKGRMILPGVYEMNQTIFASGLFFSVIGRRRKLHSSLGVKDQSTWDEGTSYCLVLKNWG